MRFNISEKVRNFNYAGLWITLRFYLIIILIIFVILGFIFGYLGIAIIVNNEFEASLLWLLLNSFIYGVYFSFLGIMNKGIRKEWKIYILILFIFLFLCGFGLADIEFHIDLKIPLWHKTFSTSTVNGVLFFISPLNLALFVGIYAFSFTIESETQ